MTIKYNGIVIYSETQMIRHRGRHWMAWRKTSVTFRLIQALILGGGLSTAQLFWAVYGNDPAGGPEVGRRAIDVWIYKKAHIFEQLDLELRIVKTAGVRFLSLEPTHRF